jgi:nicotinate phosphoribosyltransferase
MPPPPPLPALAVNPLSVGLDAYHTVAAAHQVGMENVRATFECTISLRAGSLAVLAGIEPLVDALERFRIKTEEATYLREVGAVDPALARKLDGARFTCDVDAVPEGAVVCSNQPVVTVEGPFWQAQLVAAWVLSSIDGATQVATQIAKCSNAADGAEIIEAGSNVLGRLGGNVLHARAAYIGGAGATTHALAGRRYGVPVRALQPISFVLGSKNEQAAFEAWLRAVPEQPIVRVDVRDVLAGIDKIVAAARARATASWSDAPIAIEMDADEVLDAWEYAYERFAKAGLKEPVIVVSGVSRPEVVSDLRRSGAPIAAFVIAPLVAPEPHATYDLVAIEEDGQWSPRLRVSVARGVCGVPGRKVVLRYFDADGHPVGDVAHAANERHTAARDAKLIDVNTGQVVKMRDAASSAPLLRNVMRAGKRVQAMEPARELRERSLRAISSLLPKHKRAIAPARYPSGVTPTLAALRRDLAGI